MDPAFVECINSAAAHFQAKIREVQLLTPMQHAHAATTKLVPLRHQYPMHTFFPSLLAKIPESFPSNGDLTMYLLNLSETIEQERSSAVKK